MKAARGSAIDRAIRMDDETAELLKRREDVLREAAFEFGQIVIEAGGLRVDRVALAEAVRAMVGAGSEGGSVAKRRSSKSSQAGE